jgi:hypothetical protein
MNTHTHTHTRLRAYPQETLGLASDLSTTRTLETDAKIASITQLVGHTSMCEGPFNCVSRELPNNIQNQIVLTLRTGRRVKYTQLCS